MPISAIVFLALTATISLIWSHYELLWSDEFGILITDRISTIGRLLYVQRTTPISLDPIVYHLLAHACIKLFGPGAFAIRFPSLIGYLTMQVCLFSFVRRAASERAAVFALVLTVIAGTLWYAGQGRPYGLLLGFFGLVMVSWQTAARHENRRFGALIMLSLATALALNTHYYAVLLLIPLCGAELFRTLQRRRFDMPLLLAIGVGIAGIAGTLPFLKGAAEFRRHYYTHSFNFHVISHAYMWMLVGALHVSINAQRAIELGLILVTLGLLMAGAREVITGRCPLPKAELVFLVLLAALPFFGYVLAKTVTHVLEARFVLGAILGIASLLSIGVASLFRRERTVHMVLVIFFFLAAYIGLVHIIEQRTESQQLLVKLTLPPETEAAVQARPNQPIFILNWNVFQLVKYYAQDPEMRQRIAMFYSREQELRCCGTGMDTMTLTVLHTQQIMKINVQPFEALAKQPGEHLFVVDHESFGWTKSALAAAHAKVTYLGPAYWGDLVSVSFQ